MVTGTGTLSIEETFLGPQALPPPPTRHALFAILITLGVLLHFGTIGIGDLYSEPEGQFAAAAGKMIQVAKYLWPTNDSIPRWKNPPLLYWLIVASYKVFGINTAATRVPIAFSVVATLAFTFLIGERLADYWRGFAAGLIYLTLTGTFIFGRIVMPEPLFAALFAGAIYCGLAGFQQRHQRRTWFTGFWICAALACLTKGPHGLLFPAATFAALAIFYREARMRFRSLLWWPYLLLFLAIIGPWYLWIEIHFDGPFHRIVADEWIKHLVGRYPNGNWYDDVPRWQFLTSHLAWWFPWSLAILPAPMFSWRRVMRPREISFQDALPMVWAIVVLAPVLAIGQRQDYYALSMISAIARIAPFFSLAEAARFLNSRLGTNGQVLFEGPPEVASSLGFYLERKFAMVNQEPDPRMPLTPEQRSLFLEEKAALEQWRVARPVFLIVEEDRVVYWRGLLVQHFHVYHQVASFGTYIILSNQM